MQLPDIRRSMSMDRAGPAVRAGSWWRLAGERHDLAERELRAGALAPEAPLTLLVGEVRVHDGEIHSVHLAPHPAWKSEDPVRLLADDFFAQFVEVHAAEAEARRQREIDALMGLSQRISGIIGAGPSPEEIALLAEGIEARNRREAEEAEARRRKEAAMKAARAQARAEGAGFQEVEARGRKAWAAIPERVPAPPRGASGHLPAALLPGGDVLAVQERIAAEITRMQAMGDWVNARSKEMTAVMNVVGAYQNEKVRAMTAGISDRTRQAQAMMANVQTMQLFLGEGVDLWRAVEGESAPAEDRLHLMQSMLYLDEEILVEGCFGTGIRHGDIRNLPDMLAANPSLVGRMMPHPRCVAIARVRRKDVPIDIPPEMSFGEAFRFLTNALGEQDLDKRIFILVRDGGNVSVVTADEQTSKAERLFPSRAEIDGLYRASGRDGLREISPQDIEYSDRRTAHDNRALFYKRFLLLLWGLHEREGIFGPFMPKGMNWLEESVSERFTYVHDEENVLTTGRMPVLSWLAQGQADLRPGSEVLVDTRLAFTEDFAPSAWKEGTAQDRYASRCLRAPRDGFVRAVVARSGGDLVISVPSLAGYNEREMNTPLIVRSSEGASPQGILNLGTATPGRLRDYMESRIERKDYTSWFHLFHTALPLLEARRKEEKDILGRMAEAGVDEEAATRAIALFRETVRDRRLPQGDAEIARVTLNARAFAAPQDFDAPDVLGVRLRANGKVVRLRAAAPRHGLPVQALDVEADRKRQVQAFSAINPRGEALLIGADRLDAHLAQVKRMLTPGLVFPEDMDVLEGIDGQQALHAMEPRDLGADEALAAGRAFIDHNMRSTRTHIDFPVENVLAGAVVLPTVLKERDVSWGPKIIQGRTIVLAATRTPLAQALASGHRTIVRDAVAKIAHRNYVEHIMERLEEPARVQPRLTFLHLSSVRQNMHLVKLMKDENLVFRRLVPMEAELAKAMERHRVSLRDRLADPLTALLATLAERAGDLALREAIEKDMDRLVIFERQVLARLGEGFVPPLEDSPEP